MGIDRRIVHESDKAIERTHNGGFECDGNHAARPGGQIASTGSRTTSHSAVVGAGSEVGNIHSGRGAVCDVDNLPWRSTTHQNITKLGHAGRKLQRRGSPSRSRTREIFNLRRKGSAREQRIQEKLKPYAAQLDLLQDIPGVDWTLAAVIIAELGVDMSVFQSVSQLASWVGVCPGNNASAGKRKSSRIPKGNVYLKTALVEAANAAAKAKGTYLRDKFYRLKARRGYKRAAVAIAHKILVAIYHMFSQQVSYNDLGDLYLDKLNKHHLTRNLVHRLQRLGYAVTLTLQEKTA